jgi:hypothetical protein
VLLTFILEAIMNTFEQINDETLSAKLHQFAGSERRAVGNFLLHLNEVIRRRLHLAKGWSSAFKYLVGEFNFSEPTAAKRLASARVVSVFPESLEYLLDGRVHLTGFYLLSKYLKEDNWRDAMMACSGKSKVWIEDYIARTFVTVPAAPKRDVVRAVAVAPRVIQVEEARSASLLIAEPFVQQPALQLDAPSQEFVRISTTVDRETLKKLQRLQDILGVNGLGEVIAKAADVCLKKVDPSIAPPRAKLPMAATTKRFIPKALKHQVFTKGQGRCTFVGSDHRRCEEQRGLQVDHVLPLALGGKTEGGNLRILCAAHNRFMARTLLGDKMMDQFLSPGKVEMSKVR